LKVRTTSAKFSIRSNLRKDVDWLCLDLPHPPKRDYEWALRMEIDKYFYLEQHPEIEDGGSWSSGLCIAADNLSNMDNQCGDCPIKIKTGKSNCEATPLKFLYTITTYEERRDIYNEMLVLLTNLYKEMYHDDYKPEIKEEDSAVILQQKNKPIAGSPGGTVRDL
jgi:hypothetical protein